MKRLDAAVALRVEADRSVEALREDYTELETDRARLAAKLDEAEARARRLREANHDVAVRLVTVMERVRRLAPSNTEDGL